MKTLADSDSGSYEMPFMNEEHALLDLIKESPELFAKLEEEVGHIGRFLKSGANGSVYEVSDPNQVLKLTADPDEVKAANVLLNKPMPEAVTVYGVWELSQVYTEDGGDVWAILMEKLVPLGPNEKQFIRAFQGFQSASGVTPERVDAFEARYKGKFKKHLFDWLRKAAENLEDREIVNRDMHSQNVMMRPNGQLSIIDMGGGSEAPKSRIKKLAAMFEALAKRVEAFG